VTEEFFLQLTAEKLTTEFRNGFPRRVWIQTRDRNEELDKFVYGLAAVKELNPNWAALAKNLGVKEANAETQRPEDAKEEKPSEPKPEVATVPAVRRPVARRRGNWVNGWR
jgi:phage terminase large subunit GpA-like protein